MKREIKIWHLFLLFWIATLLLRLGFLIDIITLGFKYIGLLFTGFSKAMQVMDFALFDSFASGALFILLPLVFLAYRRKLKWLDEKINFSVTVIFVLFFAFLFAPVITNENPDFQKDLRVTKLLMPFSSVKVIHLKEKNKQESSAVAEFMEFKNYVIKPSFNESIIFADKVETGSKGITYYQKGIKKELNNSELKLIDDKPVIESRLYLLGTDEFGRDILTRLIYGARISLLVGIGSVIVSLLIGLTFGFLAGFKGGALDVLLSRTTDLFLAFPVIYLIVLILALFGNSLISVIVVLGISGWMSLFKIVKSEVLSAKKKDYIITAQMLGLNKRKILLNEILPVIFAPLLVNIVFQFSNVILAESALSYLGLGTGSSYPSWGAMIEAGQQYINKAWWMILFPGLALIFTLFSANDIGRKIKISLNPQING